jgi:hypothetical protein
MVVVSSGMPSQKPLLHIVMDEEFLDRIDEYQHEQRFPSRSAAVKALLDWALNQAPDLGPKRLRARLPKTEPTK